MSINIVDFQHDIAAKARSVRIVGMEWQDVVQELNLHLLTVQHKYDPAKSSPRTFISRVSTNKIRDLIRRVSAMKRSYSEIESLDELMERGFDYAYEQFR